MCAEARVGSPQLTEVYKPILIGQKFFTGVQDLKHGKYNFDVIVLLFEQESDSLIIPWGEKTIRSHKS